MSAESTDPEIATLRDMVDTAVSALDADRDDAVVARLMDGTRRLVDAYMTRGMGNEAAALIDTVWELPGLADFGIERAILGLLGVRVLQTMGRNEQAVARALEAALVATGVRGDGRGLGAPLLADLAQARAASLEMLGRREEARDAQAEAVARRAGLVGRTDLPDQRPGLASARNALGRILLALEAPEEAIEVLSTCIDELHAIAEATEQKLPPMLFNTHAAACNRLGRAYIAAGKPFEAHPHLMSSVEAMRSLVDETRNLALVEDFLTALGDLEKAERAMGNDAVAANLAAEATRWREHARAGRK